MHDLLEQMGRRIVVDKSPDDVGNRSRLWSKEDIDEGMENNLENVVHWKQCRTKNYHISLLQLTSFDDDRHASLRRRNDVRTPMPLKYESRSISVRYPSFNFDDSGWMQDIIGR
ncbi:hypothetical protein K1719_047005 [Acacia pycnantha]|nr:hypothetical protein K1719_047005 [Acacia pycnantha]